MDKQHCVQKATISVMALRHALRRRQSTRLALFSLVLCLGGATNASALQGIGGIDTTSPGKIGPVGPQYAPVVNVPLALTINSRGTTQVGLSWWQQGAPQTLVKRSVNGGPWMTIQTYGELPTNAMFHFQDQNATVNAENCYVVTATDGSNSWSALSTPMRCAFTRDGRDLTVHRLQLRIRVPYVSDAGTDDDVEIRLQTPSWLVSSVTNWSPAGNSTWIDSTADDFECGSDRTYDLMLTNVSQVSDITMITINKTGDDDLCVAEVELLIDGQPAHRQTFGDQAATCAWVTDSNPVSVGFNELRASFLWNTLGLPTFTGINGAGLRSVIEAIFAHNLHGRGELRNGGTTLSQRVSESKIHVAVPIVVYDVHYGPVNLGDVDSTVYFDLVMTLGVDGTTTVSVENENADSFDLLAVLFPVVVAPILYEASSRIEDEVADLDPFTLDPSPLPGTHVCFAPDAGISLCSGSSPRFDRSLWQVERAPVASSLE